MSRMSQVFLDLPQSSAFLNRYQADLSAGDVASGIAQLRYERRALRECVAIARGCDHIPITADHVRLLLGLLHHLHARSTPDASPF